MKGNKSFTICAKCGRFDIDYNAKQCNCGGMYSSFNFEPHPNYKNLMDKELSERYTKLGTPEFSTDNWPGPIAFEYFRLNEMLKFGNIEGSCWKLVNLYEVIMAYFYSVWLERKGEIRDIKYSVIIRELNNISLNELMDNIYRIKRWRNNYGIGHGSLTRNRMNLISEIIEFYKEITKSLERLDLILNQLNVSLYLVDKGENKKLTGKNYIHKIGKDDWDKNVHTYVLQDVGPAINPIKIFGYQFDGPDIYFMDMIDREYFKYRNYMKNRTKYVYRNNQEIDWDKDPRQVSWFLHDERKSWLNYLSKKMKDNKMKIEEKYQLLSILIDGFEGYQDRGMYEDVDTCSMIINDYVEYIEKRDILDYRTKLVKYRKTTSVSNEPSDSEIRDSIKMIGNKQDKLKCEAKYILAKSWYMATQKQNNEAINLCKEVLVKIEQAERDIELELLRLELKKNILYYAREIGSFDKNNIKQYLDDCVNLIGNISVLHENLPDDFRVIDIIGFLCNLYGQYMFKLDEINEEDISNTKALHQYGLRLRRLANEELPDDIWTIRGYAWSIHHGARIKHRIDKDLIKAKELLDEALKVRKQGEEKFPQDLGLKEDIIKNYEEFFKVDRANKDYYKEEAYKIMKDSFSHNEGLVERCNKLKALFGE